MWGAAAERRERVRMQVEFGMVRVVRCASVWECVRGAGGECGCGVLVDRCMRAAGGLAGGACGHRWWGRCFWGGRGMDDGNGRGDRPGGWRAVRVGGRVGR